jgi:hypothetical protein
VPSTRSGSKPCSRGRSRSEPIHPRLVVAVDFAEDGGALNGAFAPNPFYSPPPFRHDAAHDRRSGGARRRPRARVEGARGPAFLAGSDADAPQLMQEPEEVQ